MSRRFHETNPKGGDRSKGLPFFVFSPRNSCAKMRTPPPERPQPGDSPAKSRRFGATRRVTLARTAIPRTTCACAAGIGRIPLKDATARERTDTHDATNMCPGR